MEAVHNSTNQELPPCPRRSAESRHFNLIPPSTLPSAPGYTQAWRKPSSMNHGDVTGADTKSTFDMLDIITTLPLSSANDNRKPKNPCPPLNSSQTSDDLLTSAIAAVDNKSINGAQVRSGRYLDPKMDPKKLRRIISNRVSAQKSRLKKLQYVSEMERKVKALEDEIAALSPQVALYRSQKQLLQIEQERLKVEMSACASNKMLRDAEIEEMKAEVTRLRQLHFTQQQQKVHGLSDDGLEQIVNPNLIQCASNYETANGVDELNELITKQQPVLLSMPMPGWAADSQATTERSSDQSGAKLKNLGGIEQILNPN